MNPSLAELAAEAVLQPSFEGDFTLHGDFSLEDGGVLRDAILHYVLYGNMNSAHDNVILVCHALSGSARVADWWPAIFSSHGLIDLKHDAVLGINILGSCYGSTGPASIDPSTGGRYGSSFPLISIGDVVRSQALLLDALAIPCLRLAIGASVGGMQVIEWSMRFPTRINRAIAIGVAPLGAMGLGLNHLQRKAIMLDPDWRNGEYSPEAPPRRGLALARAIATCSYKSSMLFNKRFGRKPDRNIESSQLREGLAGARFDVAGYLDHQGETFNHRFDANSYLLISRAMDLFDPTRGYDSTTSAWSRIQAEVTLVGISSDWLFPAADVLTMGAAMVAAGVRCEYRELVSDHGHDAFLAEPQSLFEIFRGALP